MRLGGGLVCVVLHSAPLHGSNDASAWLQVGVGTSRLQEALVKQGGYRHITNMDISEVVVSQMAEAHKDLPELSYEVADVRYACLTCCWLYAAVLPYVQDQLCSVQHM